MSGNRSKKWNKFDVWCMTLAGLPREESVKFPNVHFISCSNRLSALEMADPLVQDLKILEKGIKVYDSVSESYIFHSKTYPQVRASLLTCFLPFRSYTRSSSENVVNIPCGPVMIPVFKTGYVVSSRLSSRLFGL